MERVVMKDWCSGIATVDATGFDYSDTNSQTVAGLWAQADKAYKSGKPVLLYGWDYNGTVMSPMYVYLMPSGTSYIVDGKISISNANAVTRL